MLRARDPEHLPQQHGLGRDAVAQRREEAHVRRQVRAGREQVHDILPGGVGARGLSAGHETRRDLLVETLLRAQGRVGRGVVGDSKGPQIPHMPVEAREEVGTHVRDPHDHVPGQQPREDRAPHGVHKEGMDQGQLILHHGLHRHHLGELKQTDVEHVVERGQSTRHDHMARDRCAAAALYPRHRPARPPRVLDGFYFESDPSRINSPTHIPTNTSAKSVAHTMQQRASGTRQGAQQASIMLTPCNRPRQGTWNLI